MRAPPWMTHDGADLTVEAHGARVSITRSGPDGREYTAVGLTANEARWLARAALPKALSEVETQLARRPYDVATPRLF